MVARCLRGDESLRRRRDSRRARRSARRRRTTSARRPRSSTGTRKTAGCSASSPSGRDSFTLGRTSRQPDGLYVGRVDVARASRRCRCRPSTRRSRALLEARARAAAALRGVEPALRRRGLGRRAAGRGPAARARARSSRCSRRADALTRLDRLAAVSRRSRRRGLSPRQAALVLRFAPDAERRETGERREDLYVSRSAASSTTKPRAGRRREFLPARNGPTFRCRGAAPTAARARKTSRWSRSRTQPRPVQAPTRCVAARLQHAR